MTQKSFEELLESVREMKRVAKRRVRTAARPAMMDPGIRQLRERMGLTQVSFASLIGVTTRTLDNWEQGRRVPTGPARALFKLMAADPQGVVNALHAA